LCIHSSGEETWSALWTHTIGVYSGIYQECRNSDVQISNFSCCCMWVWRTFREERRLRVFENRVLREVLGYGGREGGGATGD
jgi:hypothetical protein